MSIRSLLVVLDVDITCSQHQQKQQQHCCQFYDDDMEEEELEWTSLCDDDEHDKDYCHNDDEAPASCAISIASMDFDYHLDESPLYNNNNNNATLLRYFILGCLLHTSLQYVQLLAESVLLDQFGPLGVLQRLHLVSSPSLLLLKLLQSQHTIVYTFIWMRWTINQCQLHISLDSINQSIHQPHLQQQCWLTFLMGQWVLPLGKTFLSTRDYNIVKSAIIIFLLISVGIQLSLSKLKLLTQKMEESNIVAQHQISDDIENHRCEPLCLQQDAPFQYILGTFQSDGLNNYNHATL